MGCPFSRMLFVMATQVIIDEAISCVPGPSLKEESALPILMPFMDDARILTPDGSYADDMLPRLDGLIRWCWMTIKPKR